jgi:molecular chaperone DnaK
MGGVFTKLIEKNTTIPVKKSQVFSTAEDNQPAVTIRVGQGERELAQYNKMLGMFNLEGIAPAPRGMPQIEVTFDIDANGIINVSAKDKGTNKEQKITIQSNSGLSEDEIQQMIKDAELNAEADKKQRELIEARNGAEGQVHSIKKELEKHGDSLDAVAKTKIEDAIKAVEEACKGEDKEAITTAMTSMFEAAGPLFEAANKANNPEAQAEGAKKDDDIIDATFTEVDKDKAA